MQKLVIKIRKGKHHTAKSIITGLYQAQKEITEVLEKAAQTPQDKLLLLHAVEFRDMLRDMQRPQQQYTIKLTIIQAEAYRQLWGRFNLKYEAYGAVQVQNLLNEINRELDRPLLPKVTVQIVKGGLGGTPDIEDFNPNHFGTL